MTSEPFIFNWYDERQGKWTIIEEDGDRVIVRLSSSHRLGRWFSVVIAVLVIMAFSRDMNRTSFLAILVGLAVVCGALLFIKRSLNSSDMSKRSIVAEIYNDCQCEGGGEHRIVVDKILRLIVRMNKGRYHQDQPMWQLYLHLRDEVYCKLIYQDLMTAGGRKRTEDIARHLAQRWSKELVIDEP